MSEKGSSKKGCQMGWKADNAHRSYLVRSGKASWWKPYRSVDDACARAGI